MALVTEWLLLTVTPSCVCICWLDRRLQEMEAQHKSLQQEQEAAEFEKLQAKFGFSDKVGWRPGVLHTAQAAGQDF